MSIKPVATWAPSPSTERGKPTQLSVDAKGQRLAYVNQKSVFLRSIDNPAESTQYTGHTATTTVARFSPSGFYVASGDSTGTVKVWDCIGEGGTRGTYQITRSINDLAWDGDSQRIIAVGDGKERFGHCITADSGNSVGEISGHTAQINTIAIRQQRPLRAATGSDDTSIAFFHGAPFKFNTSLRGQHNRYIYGVAFSPDGSLLASVGADKKIWLFDGKTGEVKGEIGAGEHKGSIFSISWSKDSKRFVTSSADQTVKIWDAESGKSTQSWRLGEEGVVDISNHQVGVVWTPRSDDLIISLSLSGDLNYLGSDDTKPRKTLHGHQRNITALGDLPSQSTIWTGDSSGRICAWNSHEGLASAIDGESHKNYISGLSADSKSVFSIGWDDTLRTIDTSASTFKGTTSPTDGQPRGVASTGSNTVVGTHKAIQVFDAAGKQASVLNTTFSTLCLAASNGIVVAGADDTAIHTYKLSGKELTDHKAISTGDSQPSTLAFTADGSMLAVGHTNGKIMVYSVSDWSIAISRWSAHTAKVQSIAWRKDGKFAASGALDTNVFVWSVERPGKRVVASNSHKEGVNAVTWDGDDKVVSAGVDAAVKIWNVQGLE